MKQQSELSLKDQFSPYTSTSSMTCFSFFFLFPWLIVQSRAGLSQAGRARETIRYVSLPVGGSEEFQSLASVCSFKASLTEFDGQLIRLPSVSD